MAESAAGAAAKPSAAWVSEACGKDVDIGSVDWAATWAGAASADEGCVVSVAGVCCWSSCTLGCSTIDGTGSVGGAGAVCAVLGSTAVVAASRGCDACCSFCSEGSKDVVCAGSAA